jgi:hypothetical protein
VRCVVCQTVVFASETKTGVLFPRRHGPPIVNARFCRGTALPGVAV